MKKFISLALCAVMALSLAACGGAADKPSTQEKPGDTMSLEEILNSINDGVEELPGVDVMEVPDELFENYAFIKPIEGAEAWFSEAMVNAIAHSTVVIRVPEGTDVAAVAKDIEANADPRKWICTEAEKVTVTVHGNTILLVMSFTDTADAITANFDGLWK